MGKQIGVLFLLVVVTAVSNASEPQQASIERWDRVVGLQTERKATDGLPAFASAFVVAHEENLYLVTAAHASQDTHSLTKVLYRSTAGESRWVHLGGIVNASTNPWRTHENTDLAFLLIQIQLVQSGSATAIYVNELKELAIPFAALAVETPRRTERIEITGYPMSLGANPPLAPLTMVAHVASREMSADAKWGKETVFYAVPTVAAGCSGGPVFAATDDSSKPDVVGMHTGLIVDATGAKLSKIIPSRVIRTAIEQNTINHTQQSK
ncbi:MAG: trypsin-like peptidase domain-containing protein [Planctomycetota bacterium]